MMQSRVLTYAFNICLTLITKIESIPPKRITITLVGTRGDVQPFISFAFKLQEYGHTVKIATHKLHQTFVESYGIRFAPISGTWLRHFDTCYSWADTKLQAIHVTWSSCAYPAKVFRWSSFVKRTRISAHLWLTFCSLAGRPVNMILTCWSKILLVRILLDHYQNQTNIRLFRFRRYSHCGKTKYSVHGRFYHALDSNCWILSRMWLT